MQPVPRDHVVLTFSPQPSVAEFLSRIADEAGFASQATSTVEQLRQAVHECAPDAILYEIGFPFTDNWHQLTHLRAQSPLCHVPVIVTTADAGELYRRVGVPALELFRKPDDLTEVRTAVLSAIATTV